MDNLAVLSLLALTPILLVGVLLVGFRLPAMYAMPAGYIVVVGIAVHFWNTEWTAVAASSLQGLILALGLLYIIFGGLDRRVRSLVHNHARSPAHIHHALPVAHRAARGQ